jgi:hypothetical protein
VTAIQCSMLGLAMCWLNTLIGYAKSGRVHNMAYIKDPIACWYGKPLDSSFPFAFFCNFTLGLNGTPMGLHGDLRLGGQTCWRTFGFHSWLCVSLFNYRIMIIFLLAYFLQVWVIFVHVNLGFVVA